MRDSCDFCLEGRLKPQQVREYYRAGKGLVVMDRVPAYVCAKCGERYYDAHVAKQMRELAKRRGRVKARISFPLIRFRTVRHQREDSGGVTPRSHPELDR